MKRFDFSDILAGVCTTEEYVDQYPAVTPQLGHTYRYAPNDWMGGTVKIVFVDDRIALGLEEPKHGAKLGNYHLYYASGPFAGFKYQDTARPFYRLTEEVT